MLSMGSTCAPTAWNESELSRTFSRAAMRLTGKKTNPHLVRDMVGRRRFNPVV